MVQQYSYLTHHKGMKNSALMQALLKSENPFGDLMEYV